MKNRMANFTSKEGKKGRKSENKGSASVRKGEAGVPYPSYGLTGTPRDNSFAAQSGVAEASPRPRDLDLQAKMEMRRRQLPSAEDLNLDRPQIRRKVNHYANIQ